MEVSAQYVSQDIPPQPINWSVIQHAMMCFVLIVLLLMFVVLVLEHTHLMLQENAPLTVQIFRFLIVQNVPQQLNVLPATTVILLPVEVLAAYRHVLSQIVNIAQWLRQLVKAA